VPGPAGIRPYEPGDAAALCDLYRRSILALGPRHYGPDQVRAWAGLAPGPDELDRAYRDGRTALVAIGPAGRPLAFGDVERDGHIGFLYCAPEAAGAGVASALYDALERDARGRGVARLHVEASEAARRFLARRGFRLVARRDLSIGGVAIHNYAMEKDLAPGGPLGADPPA
jgi:putative acetyltransferase